MNERIIVSILGYKVGTCNLEELGTDPLVQYYWDFEPYEGFEMAPGDLFVDLSTGIMSVSDDSDSMSIIDQKPFMSVMNGFVAREHHNKKKAAYSSK